ncbi:DUF5818 domain-containing protein [Cryptosporangium phraense]|uniref:Cold-shock protein n=1 Tax=Cryptosporangium phraense TaxID=2593070 RepID=A0A545AE23_9ACTN|nr:DUF5818 domain-containing protein [Cryptosporangium phraense]TQS39581.1 hypothetical protein FL583_39310 [Cryptosporangium phraense]
MRGRLSNGVEAGCILLTADSGGTWLLLGGDRSALVPGRRVQVTGEVRRGMLTTCQQGTPLSVRAVTTA